MKKIEIENKIEDLIKEIKSSANEGSHEDIMTGYGAISVLHTLNGSIKGGCILEFTGLTANFAESMIIED